MFGALGVVSWGIAQTYSQKSWHRSHILTTKLGEEQHIQKNIAEEPYILETMHI